MPQITADTTARAARIAVGTLNVWIQRRLLPGVSVNASGKRRIFDEDDVIHVAVMAQLVRLGLASPIASEAAAFARGRWNEPNAMLAIGPAEEEDRLSGAELQYYVYSSEEANKIGPDKLYGWRERPEGYVIVELARLAARVKQLLAEESTKAEPQQPASDEDAAA